jgi:hypothetical protein
MHLSSEGDLHRHRLYFFMAKAGSHKVLRVMNRESILTFDSDSREMPQSIPEASAEMLGSETASTPKSPQSI